MPVHAMQRHGLVGDSWLGITKIKKPGLYGRAFLVSRQWLVLHHKKDHPKVAFDRTCYVISRNPKELMTAGLPVG